MEALRSAAWSLPSALPFALLEPLRWERDGRDWPNREASRFVEAAGLRWHVQELGRGPVLLLVHGTGASTHSWRALAPALAEHFTVVAPDLPGHGFSEPSSWTRSLPEMARALGELLHVLDHEPCVAVGHSAGAAIACRMSLDGEIRPRDLVSLNGALLPLDGVASQLFAPLAQLLVANPLVPWLLARRSRDPEILERFLRGTGSRLDAEGLRLYRRLLGNPRHVAATLAMMASWDLKPLFRDLPRLEPRLRLVVAENDRYIPASDAATVAARVPGAAVVTLPELGHLAHEERPDVVAALLAPLSDGAARAAPTEV